MAVCSQTIVLIEALKGIDHKAYFVAHSLTVAILQVGFIS